MSSSKIQAYNLDNSVFDGLAREDYVSSTFQSKHIKTTITLQLSAWSNNSQTVSCSGVTSNNTVIISPTPNNHTDYGKANVRCTAQSANTLVFSCDKTPTSNLSVNILIMEV